MLLFNGLLDIISLSILLSVFTAIKLAQAITLVYSLHDPLLLENYNCLLAGLSKAFLPHLQFIFHTEDRVIFFIYFYLF